MCRDVSPRILLIVAFSSLSTGCLSGSYDKDFEARLQEYRREADGEPPAAAARADGVAPPAAPADGDQPPAAAGDGGRPPAAEGS
jgi:hypothetical protein